MNERLNEYEKQTDTVSVQVEYQEDSHNHHHVCWLGEKWRLNKQKQKIGMKPPEEKDLYDFNDKLDKTMNVWRTKSF